MMQKDEIKEILEFDFQSQGERIEINKYERDNFNLLDTDYCELNCSNDDEQFKKCWDKFIEWKLKDE